MDKILNHPEVQQFSTLELLAREVVEGFITGLHKSPFHGFSVEFAEHRLYNSGESVRHIDWRLFGRTDKFFVKKFEEETNLRCQVVIDASSSMYYPLSSGLENGRANKIGFSASCAAALVYLLKNQRDAVGLSVFSAGIEVHTPARSSPAHQKNIFHELEKLLVPGRDEKNRKTSAASALHNIADSIHKRSLVVIFSDMMDNDQREGEELFSALQHLRHNKHEVILFHVVDEATELQFDFDNRPYLFTDMESGEQVKVRPAEIREQYKAAASANKNELKMRCAQYKIDFIEADINKGFRQVLLPYLIRRQKLY